MANLRISEFDANTTLNGSEIVLGVQAGNTTKISMDDIKTFTTKLTHAATDVIVSGTDPVDVLTPELDGNSVYTIDGLLLLDGGSADGVSFYIHLFGLDVLLYAATYVLSDGSSGVLDQVIPTSVADTTGITFIKIQGFIQVGATGYQAPIRMQKLADVSTDLEVLAGSYIRLTR